MKRSFVISTRKVMGMGAVTLLTLAALSGSALAGKLGGVGGFRIAIEGEGGSNTVHAGTQANVDVAHQSSESVVQAPANAKRLVFTQDLQFALWMEQFARLIGMRK